MHISRQLGGGSSLGNGVGREVSWLELDLDLWMGLHHGRAIFGDALQGWVLGPILYHWTASRWIGMRV